MNHNEAEKRRLLCDRLFQPSTEVIPDEVPPLIDQAIFDVVQAHLPSRNPKVMPATGEKWAADDAQSSVLKWRSERPPLFPLKIVL